MKLIVQRKRGKETQKVEMNVEKSWTVHQLREAWQKQGATRRSAPASPPRGICRGSGAIHTLAQALTPFRAVGTNYYRQAFKMENPKDPKSPTRLQDPEKTLADYGVTENHILARARCRHPPRRGARACTGWWEGPPSLRSTK